METGGGADNGSGAAAAVAAAAATTRRPTPPGSFLMPLLQSGAAPAGVPEWNSRDDVAAGKNGATKGLTAAIESGEGSRAGEHAGDVEVIVGASATDQASQQGDTGGAHKGGGGGSGSGNGGVERDVASPATFGLSPFAGDDRERALEGET